MGQDIRFFQNLVDQTVRKLGGYWQPLSGLARLLEELGELNELFIDGLVDNEELAGELADLFIITTSIANQYCAELNEEYELLGYSNKVQKLYKIPFIFSNSNQGLYLLTVGSGRVARIINHYEGDKKKKKTEKKQRLAEEIARFQIDLIAFANHFEIPLFFYVQQILNRDATRDKDRFSITHDPTTEESIDRFRNHLEETDYKPGKKLWGSYDWDYGQSLEGNLNNTLHSFNRFVRIVENEGLDGFVLEIMGEDFLTNQKTRNETIRKVLAFLNRNDESNNDENYGFVDNELLFFYRGQGLEWYPFINEEAMYILFQAKM